MTIENNIFKYATSELSQDAVICYLLAFGKSEYKDTNTEEYNAAHKFLRECGIDGENVKEIKRQYKIQDNIIDVLVITNTYLLIIEDKIYTNEHGDQITRYVNALKNIEEYKCKTIKVCYFKTGNYLKDYVPPAGQNILSKDDCKSLRRNDILEILENLRHDNLIFDSFYSYWKVLDDDTDECSDEDISTWGINKWFKYLKGLFDGNGITNEERCDINNYVPNASGGFYATHFNYRPCEEDIKEYDGEKNNKARTYKQIELFFSDNKTFRINLAYRFHSNNWNREETKKYKERGVLKNLQDKIKTEGYKNQNRIGASTAYKVRIFGGYKSNKKNEFIPINKEKTKEIKEAIEEFMKKTS